jgi:hypothetical protein
MIDLSTLSRDEFIQLEKDVKTESYKRKRDYSHDLPVVTLSTLGEITLWYESFKNSKRGYADTGIKTLSASSVIKKEIHPASIQFHSIAKTSDRYCKYSTCDNFVGKMGVAKEYINKRINMAVNKQYTAYHTLVDGVDKYSIYFVIEYVDKSYYSQPYQYHQIVSLSKYNLPYDSAWILYAEQHTAVGGFGKLELPSNEMICDISEFNAELDSFYKQVDAVICKCK